MTQWSIDKRTLLPSHLGNLCFLSHDPYMHVLYMSSICVHVCMFVYILIRCIYMYIYIHIQLYTVIIYTYSYIWYVCACMRMTEWFHQPHSIYSIPGVPRLAHHRASRSARNVGLKHVGNICCDHVVIKSSKTISKTALISLPWLEFCVGRCWKISV